MSVQPQLQGRPQHTGDINTMDDHKRQQQMRSEAGPSLLVMHLCCLRQSQTRGAVQALWRLEDHKSQPSDTELRTAGILFCFDYNCVLPFPFRVGKYLTCSPQVPGANKLTVKQLWNIRKILDILLILNF